MRGILLLPMILTRQLTYGLRALGLVRGAQNVHIPAVDVSLSANKLIDLFSTPRSDGILCAPKD